MSQRKAVILASANQTASGTVAFKTPDSTRGSPGEVRGVQITLDITAFGGTNPTLDVKLQRLDPASGKWVDLPGAAFAQKTGTATADLTVYPGIAETANVSVSDVITEDMNVVWTIGGTASPNFTFSLGANFI